MVRPIASPLVLQSSRETRTRQILRDLALKIFMGEWKPGDLLPPERHLAILLKVSRATLREALKQLISYGLLSTRQGSGTLVLDWRSEAGMELLPLFLEAGAPGLKVSRLIPTALRLRRVLIEEIVVWLCEDEQKGWTTEAYTLLSNAWDSRHNPLEFIRKDYRFIRYLCGASGFFPALWVLNELQGIYLHFVYNLPEPPPVPQEYFRTWQAVLSHCEKSRKDRAVFLLTRYFSRLDGRLLRIWGLR